MGTQPNSRSILEPTFARSRRCSIRTGRCSETPDPSLLAPATGACRPNLLTQALRCFAIQRAGQLPRSTRPRPPSRGAVAQPRPRGRSLLLHRDRSPAAIPTWAGRADHVALESSGLARPGHPHQSILVAAPANSASSPRQSAKCHRHARCTRPCSASSRGTRATASTGETRLRPHTHAGYWERQRTWPSRGPSHRTRPRVISASLLGSFDHLRPGDEPRIGPRVREASRQAYTPWRSVSYRTNRSLAPGTTSEGNCSRPVRRRPLPFTSERAAGLPRDTPHGRSTSAWNLLLVVVALARSNRNALACLAG